MVGAGETVLMARRDLEVGDVIRDWTSESVTWREESWGCSSYRIVRMG